MDFDLDSKALLPGPAAAAHVAAPSAAFRVIAFFSAEDHSFLFLESTKDFADFIIDLMLLPIGLVGHIVNTPNQQLDCGSLISED